VTKFVWHRKHCKSVCQPLLSNTWPLVNQACPADSKGNAVCACIAENSTLKEVQR
jgi:hypothetical protein